MSRATRLEKQEVDTPFSRLSLTHQEPSSATLLQDLQPISLLSSTVSFCLNSQPQAQSSVSPSQEPKSNIYGESNPLAGRGRSLSSFSQYKGNHSEKGTEKEQDVGNKQTHEQTPTTVVLTTVPKSLPTLEANKAAEGFRNVIISFMVVNQAA